MPPGGGDQLRVGENEPDEKRSLFAGRRARRIRILRPVTHDEIACLRADQRAARSGASRALGRRAGWRGSAPTSEQAGQSGIRLRVRLRKREIPPSGKGRRVVPRGRHESGQSRDGFTARRRHSATASSAISRSAASSQAASPKLSSRRRLRLRRARSKRADAGRGRRRPRARGGPESDVVRLPGPTKSPSTRGQPDDAMWSLKAREPTRARGRCGDERLRQGGIDGLRPCSSDAHPRQLPISTDTA